METCYFVFVTAAVFAVLERLLPDGKTRTAVKRAVALVLTLYLIYPLKNLFTNGVLSYTDSKSTSVQTEFLDGILNKQAEIDKSRFITELKEYGIDATSAVTAIYEQNGTYDLTYVKIVLDLNKCVLNKDKSHIYKSEIEETCKKIFNISELEIIGLEDN